MVNEKSGLVYFVRFDFIMFEFHRKLHTGAVQVNNAKPKPGERDVEIRFHQNTNTAAQRVLKPC